MNLPPALRPTTALALALALTLSACGGADGPADGIEATAASTGTSAATRGDDTGDGGTEGTDATDDTGAGDAADTGAQTQDAGGDDGVTAAALAAVEAAQRETGGTAYEIDGDDDGTWEVDLRVDDRSVTVEVDAGGAVTRVEEDDLDAEDLAAMDAAQVSLEEAVTTALDEVGGVLDDAALEEERDLAYEVSVDLGPDPGDDVDVWVDAVTGEVLRTDA
ncbi:PepSY domain-containing protein [uncultured Serinicoccus sp.]|uniref:PepSY domain-containing protein n=1 Tax=uncultured Serinicoccus sp. TaxID=735514 RepID=UPI00261BBAAA|nr:PepSY domain-containing protein [uncultured Serinicoccus sp.]